MRFVLAALLLALGLGCADYELRADIAYDPRFGDSTEMDIYLPADARPGTPAIMLIHGGGWRYLSRDIYDDHAARFAHAGFVVANINYRLVPDGGAYPNLFQDVFCALGFLEANADEYFLDPQRIAVFGYSAGGHLASLLALAEPTDDFEPDCGTIPTIRPAAAISGAGPSDLRRTWLPNDSFVVRELIGGSADEYPERYDLASPIFHVGADEPPFLLIHGSDDLIVDYDHTVILEEALEDAGNDVRLLKIRGGGHMINPGANQYDAAFPLSAAAGPEAWAAMIDFLDSTLGEP